MKRPSYRAAVHWLAMNDDRDPETTEQIASLVTTCLVADLFGVTPERVADDVFEARIEEDEMSNGNC